MHLPDMGLAGCFIEPVPRGSLEGSRDPFMQFFDGFGISVGIHFVSVEPSSSCSFFGCVAEPAHDELSGTVADPGEASRTSLERIGGETDFISQAQAFGLAQQI